jgi:hypothetical protein
MVAGKNARVKLSNKELRITAEHIGHIVKFVEVFDPPPNDDVGVVCVVCRTCGKSSDPDSVVLLSVVESPALVADIRTKMGQLQRVYIHPEKLQ